MKLLKTVFVFLLHNLFFSLLAGSGTFYHTGLAISFGLYCQFENPLFLNRLSYIILAVPSLSRAFSILAFFNNSAIQTLDILFLFSSMLLILHHTIKVFANPSMKAC